MTQRRRPGLLATAAIAIFAALVLVTILFLIAQAATDSLLVTPPGGGSAEEIGLGSVLFAAVVGGVVGAVMAWAMSRYVPRPRKTFLIVSVIGLVLYGAVAFTAVEQVATGVWLNLMHLSVALPVVGGLAMHLPETRD